MGSVTAITNASAQVVWKSEYQPFGTTAGIQGTYEFDGGYTGKDVDDATGLIYMWHRWQDPSTGSFITEDPAHDGLLWYAYVSNNPMTFTDPTGLAGDREKLEEAAGVPKTTKNETVRDYSNPGSQPVDATIEVPKTAEEQAQDLEKFKLKMEVVNGVIQGQSSMNGIIAQETNLSGAVNSEMDIPMSGGSTLLGNKTSNSNNSTQSKLIGKTVSNGNETVSQIVSEQ